MQYVDDVPAKAPGHPLGRAYPLAQGADRGEQRAANLSGSSPAKLLIPTMRRRFRRRRRLLPTSWCDRWPGRGSQRSQSDRNERPGARTGQGKKAAVNGVRDRRGHGEILGRDLRRLGLPLLSGFAAPRQQIEEAPEAVTGLSRSPCERGIATTTTSTVSRARNWTGVSRG